ncbi:multidrug effflux MFS transporter [Yersinia enterocolitica]|nr:multidrug effflux MFS transporter [Yersinia enterocolitica]
MQQTSSHRIAPILGMLGALGPLSIDMYLPGMPTIAEHLNSGEGAVQFSLVTFFAGLVIGQLLFGPLADWLGRKRMIYAGLALFVIGSLGCASVSTAAQLTTWRFVQGFGGSIGMVIGFAIVRDLYTGRTAASLIALMMIVQGLAPILAPLLGSAIISFAPWQAIFGILAVFGVLSCIVVAFWLPETRSIEQRATSRPFDAMRNYGRLLVSTNFMPYVVATALAQAGFFAYLGGSSFVFISLHGLSPAAYSGVFAVNSLGLVAGSQIAARLLGRFQAETVVRAALVAYVVAAIVLVVLEASQHSSLLLLAALLFCVITAMSFVMSLGSVLALEAQGAISGTASALMGALRFGAGTLSSFAVGATANGTAMPMLSTIAICGMGACLVSFVAFPASPDGIRRETS